jgi:hypothetical protein
VVLANIWLRFATSPDHWISVDAGLHGGSHNFTEQVIRRRTELIFGQEYLLVPDLKPETTNHLAKDIIMEANLDDVAHGIVEVKDGAQLLIKDNETDFIYLKKALKVPGYELRVKGLSSTSAWPRGDQRNDAIVFDIEYEEVNTSEEQLRSTHEFFDSAEFVCEGAGKPGQKLTGTAFRRDGGSRFVCMLEFHEYAPSTENFNFTLKLNSGFGATDFAMLSRNSSSIPHFALSEEKLLETLSRTNTSLL